MHWKKLTWIYPHLVYGLMMRGFFWGHLRLIKKIFIIIINFLICLQKFFLNNFFVSHKESINQYKTHKNWINEYKWNRIYGRWDVFSVKCSCNKNHYFNPLIVIITVINILKFSVYLTGRMCSMWLEISIMKSAKNLHSNRIYQYNWIIVKKKIYYYNFCN